MAFGFVKTNRFSEYEITNERASYASVVDTWIGDIVLCNNITEIDDSIWDNMEFEYYDKETDSYMDIYSWYLCNLTKWEKQEAIECGLLLTYSDLLDCDVLCVDHWGTSWQNVLTDVPIFDTFEELEEWENEQEHSE